MTRADLSALIARVEAAEGPDRELDAEIHIALHPEHIVAPWMRGMPKWQSHIFFHATQQWTITARTYTDSLDAAASLVPEGFMWRVQHDPEFRASALVNKWGRICEEARARTPALALTAAALRARMAMEGEG